MATLVLGVPLWREKPLPEETARGLLLHLTELNGYGSPDKVARLLGIRRSAVSAGDRDALAQFAKMIRWPLDVLVADSPQAADKNREQREIRGVRLSSDLLDDARRRVCPQCLIASRQHRFWWDINAITTCPRHGLELVDGCGCNAAAKFSWRDRGLFRCRRCGAQDARLLPQRRADAGVLEFDNYLLSRFGAAPEVRVPVIDAMCVLDAVATAERVAAAELHGYQKKWQNAARLGVEPSKLQARGFAILRDGKLSNVLDHIWEGYKARGNGRHDGFTTAYGWFYHWFNCKGGHNFSPLLAEAFLAHGAERFSINTNSKLGELPDERRRKLSLKEAAERCECSVFAMRQIGLALEFLRGNKRSGAQHSLSAEHVDRIARDLKRSCTLMEAARDLGTSWSGIHDLMKSGVLLPAIRGGAKHKHVYVFRKDDVQALLNGLSEGVAPVDAPSAGLVRLSSVRGSYAASTSAVVQLILDKRLQVHECVAGRPGLKGLFVDPRELASALATCARGQEISLVLATRLARLNYPGLKKAVRLGLIKSIRRGGKTMVVRRSVDDFRDQYIMLVELKKLLGDTAKRVRAFMKESGIDAVPRITACRHVGYPRIETETFLAKRKAKGLTRIPRESKKEILLRAVRAILGKSDHPVESADMIARLREGGTKLGPSDDMQFFYASLWEEKAEFVHLQGFGWWFRKLSYAPAAYSPDSAATDHWGRIADAMIEILAASNHPMQKADVLSALHERGIRVTSVNPETFLRKLVARNRDRIAKLTGLGYWLKSRAYAAAGYSAPAALIAAE